MRRLRRPAQIGVGLALALAWALVGAAGDSHAADDPMLGKTAIGALDSWISADYKLATKFSLSAPGSISRISVYLYGSGTSGAQALRAIVYSDVGGAPDKLLSTSKEVTVAAKA